MHILASIVLTGSVHQSQDHHLMCRHILRLRLGVDGDDIVIVHRNVLLTISRLQLIYGGVVVALTSISILALIHHQGSIGKRPTGLQQQIAEMHSFAVLIHAWALYISANGYLTLPHKGRLLDGITFQFIPTL